MISGITQTRPAAESGGSPAGATGTTNTPVTENMFLQLLVAQLQNQDPSNPADSTQFVTQLSQFQTMEQSMNQGQDIAAMRKDLDQISAALTAANNGSSAPVKS